VGFAVALPKANRLRRSQEFSLVYQRGLRRHSQHLTLRALRQRPVIKSGATQAVGDVSGVPDASYLRMHPALRPTRIGISVSTKVSKRAVIRNRIKRRIQAALYQFLPSFAVGWDLVVVVHAAAVGCDYSQFLQELEQLLVDAEVFHGN
jgi:ribonuclease P protein component